MDMLKNIARTVYDDLTPLAISLSKAATDLVSGEPPSDRDGIQFVSKFVKTNQGQDLLSSYQMSLYQLKEVNNESVRIGNLCSTRMSAVQQTMNEEYEAVQRLDSILKQMPKMNSQLEEMHSQLNELHRQMLQTELSLAKLTAGKAKETSQTRSIIDFN